MKSGTSTRLERAPSAGSRVPEDPAWHERAGRLYEDLRPDATALIRRAYGNAFAEAELDDLYSSAWVGTLRTLERRHTDLTDQDIRRYVLAAVANHASKELRRRKRKPIAPIEAAGAVPAAGDSPEESAAAHESSQVTRDLLASMPPRRRAVMLLRYGWGLEPGEICGMLKGLSPRAYRKEITRGINELTAKVKLVEEGRWCEEREPLLKSYASGLADKDEALQAEQHLAHCRHCHEFVGKLTGQLHDLGGALVVPGALEAIDPHASLLGRAGDAVDRARESVASIVGRTESTEVLTAATGARGAGAAGAGVAAKLAGLGAAGKAAIACLGGGVAATACVAAGIGPIALGGSDRPDSEPVATEQAANAGPGLLDPPRDPISGNAPTTPVQPPGGQAGSDDGGEAAEPEPPPEPVAPEAPPVQREFGVAAAAPAPAPSSSSGSGDSGGSGGGSAVQQEFGP